MKYAFLGAGKMASALIQGMLRAKLCAASDIVVSDRHLESLKKLEADRGICAAATNADAVGAADVVLVCVKPTDIAAALEQAGDSLRGKLLISIAAGVKIALLEKAAPGCRVIRVMPNTAALVGRSTSALALGTTANEEDARIAREIFEAVGTVFDIPESQMDAVTGLSGSGPAYIYYVLEAMEAGGVAVGLPQEIALQLAIQTLAGAAEMAVTTGQHPAALREMVTSPGGTTFAGLTVLRTADVNATFVQAIEAATRRSEELSGS